MAQLTFDFILVKIPHLKEMFLKSLVAQRVDEDFPRVSKINCLYGIQFEAFCPGFDLLQFVTHRCSVYKTAPANNYGIVGA